VSLLNPSTVIGDAAPVPVKLSGDEVTVNDVAVAPAPGVKVISALPSSNARPDPTFVALTQVAELNDH
jgi:hypothetical protein